MTELQTLYASVLQVPKDGDGIDKRNFRKKILSMNLLVECPEVQEGVAHRPAKLYRFDRRKYEQFVSEGFVFDLKPAAVKKTRLNGKHKKRV